MRDSLAEDVLLRPRGIAVRGVPVAGQRGELVGELVVNFYVRLMQLDRLKAMAGALTPRMAGETQVGASPS